MGPDYVDIAKQFNKDTNSKVLIAKINAESNSSIGSKYGIKGYPSIKLFKNGEPIEYKG